MCLQWRNSMTIGPRHWLGLDISASSFDAAVAEEGAIPEVRQRTCKFPRTPEGVQACLSWAGEVVGVGLESTGSYSQTVASWLRKAGPELRVCVLNPLQVKAFGSSLAIRNKNDQVDARVIAWFAASRRPKASRVSTPEEMGLRELIRERTALKRMAAADHLRGLAGGSALVAEVRRGLKEHLKAAVSKLEKGIQELLEEHLRLKADAQRLMTIPGVGLIVSTTVLAILGDLRRFDRSRQLTAFAGVSPKQRMSGSSVRGRTRMCKQGSGEVRHMLYLAAMATVQREGPLKAGYEALVARGKPRKAALGAVMRKLLIVMRALLIQEVDYRKDPPSSAAA